MYGEPKEHDYLIFYLFEILASEAWHKGRDNQDKLATCYEIF